MCACSQTIVNVIHLGFSLWSRRWFGRGRQMEGEHGKAARLGPLDGCFAFQRFVGRSIRCIIQKTSSLPGFAFTSSPGVVELPE